MDGKALVIDIYDPIMVQAYINTADNSPDHMTSRENECRVFILKRLLIKYYLFILSKFSSFLLKVSG